MTVATTPEIDELIAAGAPVVIGVSGGKDSSAVAFATVEHLDAVGHKGPRVLIHSDLGLTEWKESLPWCLKLAERLDLELHVVSRSKGGMMERWEQRWADNATRYQNLSCVQVILPWSTPGMRFCTSELKISPICQKLVKLYPGERILNVNGIRRQESAGREKQPVCKVQPKLSSVRGGTSGVDWHPIIDWTLDEVFEYLREKDFPLHPAYLLWGLTRVSCVMCIMSSLGDLKNSARCPENHTIYRRMVDLEIASTFAFQGSTWLGDIAPEVLSGYQVAGLSLAKQRAAARQALEKRIPRHLLYVKGWPTVLPTPAEADLLADVRSQMAELMGWRVEYTTGQSVIARYRELLERKNQRPKRKAV